jgi:protein-L-isoaspartate(D-aspartate) O-methyltransferase
MCLLPCLPLAAACAGGCQHPPAAPGAENGEKRTSADDNDRTKQEETMDEWKSLRHEMVQTQIAARGIEDEKVLAAMKEVPRHEFVPPAYRSQAYEDHPLPIGKGQTISQPYIVAIMTQAMRLEGEEKVLEVGTGSGYQAAVLSHLCEEVHTIEIHEELANTARETLERLGYDNVTVYAGDGYAGVPEEQPFDAIMITAAPPKVPQPLKEQLTVDGELVLPVGDHFQNLLRIIRTGESSWSREEILPGVIFVPMTGEIQDEK